MIRKSLILSTVLILSSAVFANDIKCVTHAQCQNHTDESTACFLVKEGFETNGEEKCLTRCFTVYVGSYCKFKPGKSYGECKEEEYKMPRLKPTKKNCKNAIPQELIYEIFNL